MTKLLSKEVCIRGADAQIHLAQALEELGSGDMVDNFAELWRMSCIVECMLHLNPGSAHHTQWMSAGEARVSRAILQLP